MSTSVQTKGKITVKVSSATAIEKEIQALRALQVGKFYELMAAVGLTLEDLQAHAPKHTRKAPSTAATKKSAKATHTTPADAPAKPRKKIEPKYQNPKTGETWTGMGRSPLWIRDAKNRDRFLIAK
ncbi:H-NS family nucleoid-associated regulatory protein [Paraburkholderia sp. GAS32]|uniref:H-NS family nucleoid-associated regulatory protein n=1 Tax=Paraburkholderia sp. GAS32 TaxID=3035129 RepID=UPI003D204B14